MEIQHLWSLSSILCSLITILSTNMSVLRYLPTDWLLISKSKLTNKASLPVYDSIFSEAVLPYSLWNHHKSVRLHFFPFLKNASWIGDEGSNYTKINCLTKENFIKWLTILWEIIISAKISEITPVLNTVETNFGHAHISEWEKMEKYNFICGYPRQIRFWYFACAPAEKNGNLNCRLVLEVPGHDHPVDSVPRKTKNHSGRTDAPSFLQQSYSTKI